nr:MAG TPA: hypothetical protein [Caudoviricetes sp.]
MDWIVNFFDNLTFETVLSYISLLGSLLVAIYTIYIKCKYAKKKEENLDINSAIENKATKFITASVESFKSGMETTKNLIIEQNKKIDELEKKFNDKEEEIQQENEKKIEENKIKANQEIEELKSLQKEV